MKFSQAVVVAAAVAQQVFADPTLEGYIFVGNGHCLVSENPYNFIPFLRVINAASIATVEGCAEACEEIAIGREGYNGISYWPNHHCTCNFDYGYLPTDTGYTPGPCCGFGNTGSGVPPIAGENTNFHCFVYGGYAGLTTSSPTSSPSSPPPGPWEIHHVSLSNDFTNTNSSVKEISSEFLIGKDREPEAVLLDKNCESNITDIDISTTKDVTTNSTTLDLLSVYHDIDMSSIANSSIWNGTANELEVCQIVRLFLPASESGGNGKMVVAEDIRQISIGFDLTADFNITAGLAAATISNETATTDVSSFVRAYKCNAEDPATEDNSALAPNDGLSVCVVSNTPNEVNVKELVTMTAIQDDANLAIVQNRGPFLNSLTSIIDIDGGVMVTTRLPSNSFRFADGQSVTIQGEVEMELANGGARKLRVLVDAGNGDGEKASYDVEVNLQEGDSVASDGMSAMGNSAVAAVALDKAFAFAAALVFVVAA